MIIKYSDPQFKQFLATLLAFKNAVRQSWIQGLWQSVSVGSKYCEQVNLYWEKGSI